MKKIINLLVIAFISVWLSSCQPIDDKLETAEVTSGCTDYEVKFLFEVDGVKVYRFIDDNRYVYFTNREGKTKYEYTELIGKVVTNHVVEAECN